jgi:hypothetical protein
MLSKNTFLLMLTCILLTSLFSTVSAQTPPPEADCRYCHEIINPAIVIYHHYKTDTIIPTPTDAPYGTPGNAYECVSCHAIKSSCGQFTYVIERDCTACHVPAEQHHTPAPSTCASCHEDSRPADPHPQIQDCAVCHSDLGGSWLGAIYEHTPAPSTCTSCHEIDRPTDPHPQTRDCAECHLDAGNSWLGATYDHTPAPSTCTSCHEDDLPADPHPQLSDCVLCHRDVGESWIRY